MATITTAQAAIKLHSQLKNLSVEVNQVAVDDSANGYGPDLDDALRRMELDSVSSLTLNRQIAAFLILSRYYALVRICSLLGTRVDTESYAVEGDRQTVFDNASELRRAAAAEAAVYGYVVETKNLSQVGSGNTPVDQTQASSAWARDVLPTGYLPDVDLPYYQQGEFV